jgi:hypothetical protein
MGILEQKREVFGNIGAINVLNDNFPKLPKFDSLPSINNGLNSTQFLMDLINSLVGFDALKGHVINTITHKLGFIEAELKDALKAEFKEIVACNINPSIPTWFQNDGPGVVMKVRDIDFFDMMKVSPSSFGGNLIYTDVLPALNSKDFNTYLYYTIQTPSVSQNWGVSTSNSNMLETTFLETSTNGNNVLKFNATAGYSGKKLTQFNNDFIDSVTLFGEPNSLNSKTLINSIIEEMFGSISASIGINKSKKQLKKEAEIREVLDCIINSENDVIDDSYFTFDNETLAKMENDVNNRKNGVRRMETTENVVSSVSVEELSEGQDMIDSALNVEEEFKAVSDVLNNLAKSQASLVLNPQDLLTAQADFFSEMIKTFTRSIMNLIITPKFIALFAINHQIIYGQGVSYDGPVDFLKKNKKLVKSISKRISQILLDLLLKLALKHLTIKLTQKLADDNIEKGKSYVKIVLSYLGIPPSIMGQITNL